MLGICIAIVGFSILFSVHNHTNVEYGALFLAAIGTYTAMPLALCWYSMNGKFLFIYFAYEDMN